MRRLARLAFLAATLLAADPFTGTWKLNFEKSRTSAANPAPQPKSVLVTYSGKGAAMRITVRVITADGVERIIERAVPSDGKEYPRYIGAPAGDAMISRRIDEFTEESVQKRNGRVTVTTRRTVSRDGRL